MKKQVRLFFSIEYQKAFIDHLLEEGINSNNGQKVELVGIERKHIYINLSIYIYIYINI